ncbi:MAG TPA: FlgD immunoglobulin-like domain containing protein [Candidatus Krumholzibacteria bacterium]|nr:FlgD immunoglobulin-like domain containing protein [Candidatus Krumholzibacteria bacterium]
MPRPLLPVLFALLLPLAAMAAESLPPAVPHGILADRVLPLAHLEALDGSPAAPAATPARWRQAMDELARAADQPLGWPAPRQGLERAKARGDRRTVDLGLLHAAYDRLQPDGTLAVGEVFALGALRGDLYAGADAVLLLDPRDIHRHGASPVVKMTLDPGDGAGPRPLQPGVPLAAAWSSTGPKTLTLVAQTADGRTLTARALVDVKRLVTPDPDQTLAITATVPWQGAYASGQAYVLLAPGHATVTNPVVVVEGFDLDNSMDWPVLYDLLNRENLLDDLRGAGFDGVVLDFTEATEPIERNAFVLTELLTQVNAALPPGRSAALVGASMGGLVSRYALAWMEQQGLDHHVRTWISFDSPQLGADIPLGVQHWLQFFEGESSEAAFLLSRLDTPAARQMLLYHHLATSGAAAAPDPARAAWLADLDAVGGWPALPRKVAIVNGSGVGQDQGFAPGAQLIDYTYRSLLVDVDGNVWAVPDGGPTRTIFDGGINLIWPLPDTYQTVGVGGTLPWDGAPGGYRNSMAQMDATQAPYGDIVALHANHCFIPTVSALALEGAGPFHDIAGDPDLMSRTVFDQVYWPQENQEHIAITPQNKVWFMDEVGAGLSDVDVPAVAAGARPVLLPAAPNPFNPRTELRFALPVPAEVTLRVYDVKGRLVRTLAEGEPFAAGAQAVAWDGRDAAGRAAASGVYVVRMEAGGARSAGRVVLAK